MGGDSLHPHVLPPPWAQSPWRCHPAMSKTSIQLLGTSWQWGAPSLGSPRLWGGVILGSQGSGRQDGGVAGRTEGTEVGPPQGPLPKPHPPMGCARLGGAAWGRAPPPRPGRKGLRAPLQLCMQMCDMQMRLRGFYKAGGRQRPAKPRCHPTGRCHLSPAQLPRGSGTRGGGTKRGLGGTVGAGSLRPAPGRWGRGG